MTNKIANPAFVSGHPRHEADRVYIESSKQWRDGQWDRPVHPSHIDFLAEHLSAMEPISLKENFKAYVFEDNSALIYNHLAATPVNDWRDKADLEEAFARLRW